MHTQPGEIRKEIEIELIKLADCLQRFRDSLPDDDAMPMDVGYVLKQLGFLMASGSAIRNILECYKILAEGDEYRKLLIARLRDPTYTPHISEALADPDAFMDGFREG